MKIKIGRLGAAVREKRECEDLTGEALKRCVFKHLKEEYEGFKKSTEGEIDELEKKLKEQYPDFSYEYSTYGTAGDLWLIWYIGGKRHKTGGSIESTYDWGMDQIDEIAPQTSWQEADDLLEAFVDENSDLVGRTETLDTIRNLLDFVEDIPSDEMKDFKSEY